VSNHPHRRPHPHEGSEEKPRGWLARLFGARQLSGDDPVSVGAVSSRAEAEIMAGYLRNNGIKAIVSADDEGGLGPYLASQGRVRVLVPAAHQAHATKLLESMR
jgi:hypothetical protein